jgi:uncharacterized protein (DUF1778 family)
MTAKVGKRIEVRLDEKHRQMLERILAGRGTTVSEFVKKAIAKADVEERLRQLEEIFAWADEHPIDVPEDPDEFNRELDNAHNPFIYKEQFREDFPWAYDD